MLTRIPRCPTCWLPLERLNLDGEHVMALLEVIIAEPPADLPAITIGWNAVEILAHQRGAAHLLPRVRMLRPIDQLGPSFPWTVQANGTGLRFARR